MAKTEKQIVHDWSKGELQIYEIDAPIVEKDEPKEQTNDAE